ncbi:MAG: Flp family type IVb pilin [Rhodospirillaceae bacterium]|nr:Flp family type IVb pilin [Rhodospirillaceae bacterium]
MKQKIPNKIKVFKSDESGVTSIEYAVIISLLSGVLLIALPPVGTGLAGTFDAVDVAIGGQSSPVSGSTQVLGNCPKSGGSAPSGSTWGRRR